MQLQIVSILNMDKKSDSDLIFMYPVNTLIGISDFISLKYQKSYIKNLEDVHTCSKDQDK